MTNTQRNNDTIHALVPVLRDRWFEPFRAPWRRRALSVVWGGLTVAMIILIATAGSWAVAVGMPAMLVGVLLNVTMRNMADAPPEKLDERMVAVRNRAFRLAYHVAGVAIVVGITAVLVFGKDPIVIDSQQLLESAYCTALIVMFLPSAILAWTEEVV